VNHFAHLYLARPTVESRVGNLLGDFARGLDTDRLPEAVRAGLEHHRAVDAFTDAHPEVLACKALF
jgi:acyl carrier protein phosphodiesterase